MPNCPLCGAYSMHDLGIRCPACGKDIQQMTAISHEEVYEYQDVGKEYFIYSLILIAIGSIILVINIFLFSGHQYDVSYIYNVMLISTAIGFLCSVIGFFSGIITRRKQELSATGESLYYLGLSIGVGLMVLYPGFALYVLFIIAIQLQ